ncbi:MAG: DUF2007 domain-containing protein [Bacteroidia bacterium]|nr:DUF2007 domain-containing protein [Bacteroidia bacterium]MCO5253068.1 DUF2007 domain-containing protein [Bacteroidota bacterium]MCZ2129733.1 DUF2007 domain-containing protein [Bacteroidia bacterium]
MKLQKNNVPLLVTLAVFNNSTEAYLVKSTLETQGIRCFLENESINMLYANALGGVVLKVANTDFDDAYVLLQELNRSKSQRTDLGLHEINSMFVCPACGQLNENNKSIIQKKSFWQKMLIGLGLKSHKIICDYCLASFDKSELIKK